MAVERNAISFQHLATSSLYQEDDVPLGHRSVWGSWYCVERRCWGFACCRATCRDAVGCRQDMVASASEAETLAPKTIVGSIGATAEWRPSETFETREAFVAHAAQHLAARWMRWLSDGTIVAGAATENPSLRSTLLSNTAAQEALRCMCDFGQRLCQQSLPPELVSKIADMCTLIHDREYARASQLHVELSIGSNKWMSDMPVFVHFSMSRQDTEVRWTPGSGRNPVDDAGLRKHIVVLRRLLTVAQAVCPNDDPSKNSG